MSVLEPPRHRFADGTSMPTARSWLRGLVVTTEPEGEKGRRSLARVLLDVQEIAQENAPDSCRRILERIEDIALPVTKRPL